MSDAKHYIEELLPQLFQEKPEKAEGMDGKYQLEIGGHTKK